MKGRGPKRTRPPVPVGPSALRVNGYSAQWVRRGFPWVYAKEVEARGPDTQVWVNAVDQAGKVLGVGLPDTGWIALRIFRESGEVSEGYIGRLLDRALALRERVVDPNTNAYRLVHGENDGLPGVRINWWSHYADVIFDSPALGPLLPWIVNWLESTLKPRGVRLVYRPDVRDTRDFEQLDPAPGWVAGRAPAGPVRVRERGLLFDVELKEGPDVGLYTDMREVRAWLEAHWGGRRVLNTFAYTGAFSVAAAHFGASSVTTVDLSAAYLDRAEQNFRANTLDPTAHSFIQADVFKAMDRMRRTGETFDLVILDPPAFSHSEAGIWSAKKDMPRLVASAMRLLDENGWLLAASNQGELSPKEFRGFVVDGARKSGFRAQEIWFGGQGPDCPAATWFPEGRYLKVGIWRKIEST